MPGEKKRRQAVMKYRCVCIHAHEHSLETQAKCAAHLGRLVMGENFIRGLEMSKVSCMLVSAFLIPAIGEA